MLLVFTAGGGGVWSVCVMVCSSVGIMGVVGGRLAGVAWGGWVLR